MSRRRKINKSVVRDRDVVNEFVFDFGDIPSTINKELEDYFKKGEELYSIEVIYGENIDDFNLFYIHEIVKNKIAYDKLDIPLLYDELRQLEIANETVSPTKKNANDIEIQKINKTIHELENDVKWKTYKETCEDVLTKWAMISSDSSRGISSMYKEVASEEKIKQRNEYIDEYIKLVDRLDIIPLLIDKKETLFLRCPFCDTQIKEIIDEDNVCLCGYTPTIYSDKYEISTEIEISPVQRNTVDMNNFNKAVAKFEGTFKEKIPPNLYEDLDKWFLSNKLPTSDEIKANQGLANKMELKTLITALKETGHSSLYPSVNYIRHIYWGWECPCLDDYRDHLMRNYIIFQLEYDKIRTTQSNYNINIILYQLLRSIDFDCNLKDFKIPNGDNSVQYADEMWGKICKTTGMKYTSIK